MPIITVGKMKCTCPSYHQRIGEAPGRRCLTERAPPRPLEEKSHDRFGIVELWKINSALF